MSIKILVIEDEEAINSVISMSLRATGYRVTSFLTGRRRARHWQNSMTSAAQWSILCFREKMGMRYFQNCGAMKYQLFF